MNKCIMLYYIMKNKEAEKSEFFFNRTVRQRFDRTLASQ